MFCEFLYSEICQISEHNLTIYLLHFKKKLERIKNFFSIIMYYNDKFKLLYVKS